MRQALNNEKARNARAKHGVSAGHAQFAENATRPRPRLKGGTIREQRLEAIQLHSFEVGGFAAFISAPKTPYEIEGITDTGYLRLRGNKDDVSPCRMQRFI